MKLAPIVVFTYNRLQCLIETIQHLKQNSLASKSELFIFSDGPKNETEEKKVNDVREYLHTIDGFKSITIYESPMNQGLANSVISGVTKIISKSGKVIVIEDDIITSSDFLEFMNNALDFYENDTKIWSVTGYCPPIKIPKDYPHDVFLTLRPSSWGWGTWKGRWEKIDWEIKDYSALVKDTKKQRAFNKGGNDLYGMLRDQMNGIIDSWAIRWSYNQFNFGKFSIYPVQSRVKHIGFGKDATHVKKNKERQSNLNESQYTLKKIELNREILKEMKKLHQTVIIRFLKKVIRGIRTRLN